MFAHTFCQMQIFRSQFSSSEFPPPPPAMKDVATKTEKLLIDLDSRYVWGGGVMAPRLSPGQLPADSEARIRETREKSTRMMTAVIY